MGALSLSFTESREFSPEDCEFMLAMGRQCAQALERARLYAAEKAARAAAERASERTARLQALTASLSTALTPDQVAEVILREGLLAIQADASAILLLNEAKLCLEIRHTSGFPAGSVLPSIPLDVPYPVVDVVRTHAPVWVGSHQDFVARYAASAPIRAITGHQAVAYLPLPQHGRVLGAMTFSFAQPREFNREEQAFMLTLARLCAQALERARLYDAERSMREAEHQARTAAQRTADRLARLQTVTAELTGALTPAAVVEVILHQGVMASNAAAMSIKLLSDDGQWLESLDMVGFPAEVRARYQRYPVSTAAPLAEAVRTGQPIWLTSQQAYIERYPHLAEEITALGIEAGCAIPLSLGSRTLGGLAITFASRLDINPEQREFLLTLARQCAQALERAQLYEAGQQARVNLEGRVAERTAELRRSNEQLRELAARLETAREEERRRVARELHDRLGGDLTGLKMQAAQMQSMGRASDPDLAARLAAHMAAIDNTLQSVRRIATELRPAILDDFGLLAAIEWQVQEFQQRSGLQCHLEVETDDTSVDTDCATAMFRVFQESLTNIGRHAQATRVTVTVEAQPGYLVLRVQDNGQGFNRAEAAQKHSLGLAGMRERMYAVAGQLEIETKPGRGTLVLVRAPLGASAAPGSITGRPA